MRRIEVPVLIVGAGPVGATAALLLAQRGMRCHLVDRRDGPHRAPQAHVLNPRTLEIYRLENGRWIVASVLAGDGRVRVEPFEAIELDLGRWWMPELP